MDLPALLPSKLKYVSSITSDLDLFDTLVLDVENFTVFFEYACDDETWSQTHSNFMKAVIEWITYRYLENKFPADFAKRAADKMRDHRFILEPLIPKNLIIEINGLEYPLNSLLLGTSSEYFHNRIRQKGEKLQLENVSPFVFEQVQEYISTGKVQDLWRHNQHEIYAVLKQVSEWELSDLKEFCQQLLKKYIGEENVIEKLLEAHKNKWYSLKDHCIEIINEKDWGVRFEKDSNGLAFEFKNFSDSAINVFESVRLEIYRLICGNNLTEQPPFSEVVNRCPSFICLDITGSNTFSDRLYDIPTSLSELDISKCGWVSNTTLNQIIKICPRLTKIGLAGNVQLTYSAWGLLKDFPNLEKLNISACSQITDEDFKIILQACRGSTHFYLSQCTGLSNNAFLELGKNIPRLTDVDVSRTNITDSALIDLVMRCKFLVTLSAARCANLSEKGILEVVKKSPHLKRLDISKCAISPTTLLKIKNINPNIQLIF